MKKIFNHISIIALSLLIGARCQSPESSFTLPEPNPASAEITLNSDGTTIQTIGPDGGVIEILSADGWDYRFSIPKGFLVSETEITMTPISRLTSPMLKTFTAGVHFEPDGLVLPGVAWLEITGDVKGDKLIGLTYEGDGDEFAFNWAEVKGSTIRIPITHFSGAGAGTPAPGGAERSPSNSMRAMGQALAKAYIDNEMNCIGEDHPLGEIVVEWYQGIFESMIEPKLEAAVENDLLLSEAITIVIEWRAWRQHASNILCPRITEALENVPGEEQANKLIASGLVNAIDKAAHYCAIAHDLGETKHIWAWYAASQLLFDDETLDLQRQAQQRIEGCLTFELEFESVVEVYEYTNSMTFSALMKSKIKPLYPNAQGQLIGLIDDNDTPRGYGPLEYTPKLNYPSKPGCDVIISRIKTRMASAMLPEVTILDPLRNVPINPNKPKRSENDAQEALPDENEDKDNSESKDSNNDKNKDKLMLIFYKLEATEFIEVTCSDLWGGMNEDGAFGPYTFNNLHEDDWNYVHEGFEFELEWGYGELFGWATSEKNASNIAKEKTTFKLLHKAPPIEKFKK